MRQRKKNARKEHSEKVKQEISRLKEAFVFCHFLSCFQNEDVRSDFLNGENGAVDHLEMEDVKGHADPEKTNTESPPASQNGLQDVLSSQNSFNFLQESQIDLGAPHMDPAVVAVHQMAPPPNVNFVMNPYSASPPLEGTSPPLVNGNEPHEMSGSSVPVSQVSGLPSGIPRSVPPVLTSVQHDFDPSHPIPTQTFTNQTFAVMQNMIMPQGYVPVTMHHGPLPPHIAPIAVVPASPVTTTPASVMPMHMPVTMQDGNPQIIGDSKPEVDETVDMLNTEVVTVEEDAVEETMDISEVEIITTMDVVDIRITIIKTGMVTMETTDEETILSLEGSVHLIQCIIVLSRLPVYFEQSSSGVLNLFFPAGQHTYDRYFTRATTRG
ncbi:UNVERIFIED_CONTAM: Capr [Trichonephila clavipes]